MKSVAFAVLFALGAAAAQAGPIYTFEIFDVPGAKDTFAQGFNDAGVIVGYSVDAANMAHAFIRDGGGYSTFEVFDTFNTIPNGINNAGQITGFYTNDGNTWSGFVKSGDVYSVFDVPGASFTIPTGINDAGLIVGTWEDGAGSHGFLKDGGTYSDISFPGAIYTNPVGINNAGDIVGTYGDAGNISHGFIKRGEEYLTLNLLVGALGINDAGLIVGNGNGLFDGRVTDGVHYADIFIGQPYNGVFPRDIDNIGRVLGVTRDAFGDFRAHGFVATPTADWHFVPDPPPPPPVPEPLSLWLCGLGLAAAVRRHAKTKR